MSSLQLQNYFWSQRDIQRQILNFIPDSKSYSLTCKQFYAHRIDYESYRVMQIMNIFFKFSLLDIPWEEFNNETRTLPRMFINVVECVKKYWNKGVNSEAFFNEDVLPERCLQPLLYHMIKSSKDIAPTVEKIKSRASLVMWMMYYSTQLNLNKKQFRKTVNRLFNLHPTACFMAWKDLSASFPRRSKNICYWLNQAKTIRQEDLNAIFYEIGKLPTQDVKNVLEAFFNKIKNTSLIYLYLKKLIDLPISIEDYSSILKYIVRSVGKKPQLFKNILINCQKIKDLMQQQKVLNCLIQEQANSKEDIKGLFIGLKKCQLWSIEQKIQIALDIINSVKVPLMFEAIIKAKKFVISIAYNEDHFFSYLYDLVKQNKDKQNFILPLLSEITSIKYFSQFLNLVVNVAPGEIIWENIKNLNKTASDLSVIIKNLDVKNLKANSFLDFLLKDVLTSKDLNDKDRDCLITDILDLNVSTSLLIILESNFFIKIQKQLTKKNPSEMIEYLKKECEARHFNEVWLYVKTAIDLVNGKPDFFKIFEKKMGKRHRNWMEKGLITNLAESHPATAFFIIPYCSLELVPNLIKSINQSTFNQRALVFDCYKMVMLKTDNFQIEILKNENYETEEGRYFRNTFLQLIEENNLTNSMVLKKVFNIWNYFFDLNIDFEEWPRLRSKKLKFECDIKEFVGRTNGDLSPNLLILLAKKTKNISELDGLISLTDTLKDGAVIPVYKAILKAGSQFALIIQKCMIRIRLLKGLTLPYLLKLIDQASNNGLLLRQILIEAQFALEEADRVTILIRLSKLRMMEIIPALYEIAFNLTPSFKKDFLKTIIAQNDIQNICKRFFALIRTIPLLEELPSLLDNYIPIIKDEMLLLEAGKCVIHCPVQQRFFKYKKILEVSKYRSDLAQELFQHSVKDFALWSAIIVTLEYENYFAKNILKKFIALTKEYQKINSDLEDEALHIAEFASDKVLYDILECSLENYKYKKLINYIIERGQGNTFLLSGVISKLNFAFHCSDPKFYELIIKSMKASQYDLPLFQFLKGWIPCNPLNSLVILEMVKHCKGNKLILKMALKLSIKTKDYSKEYLIELSQEIVKQWDGKGLKLLFCFMDFLQTFPAIQENMFQALKAKAALQTSLIHEICKTIPNSDPLLLLLARLNPGCVHTLQEIISCTPFMNPQNLNVPIRDADKASFLTQLASYAIGVEEILAQIFYFSSFFEENLQKEIVKDLYKFSVKNPYLNKEIEKIILKDKNYLEIFLFKWGKKRA